MICAYKTQVLSVHIHVMMVLMRISPHKLIYLKVWPPAVRTILEGLSVAFLEDVCHWGHVLRFQKTHSIPSVLFSLPSAFEPRCDLLAVPVTTSLWCHYGLSSFETLTPVKCYLYKLFWSWWFVMAKVK